MYTSVNFFITVLRNKLLLVLHFIICTIMKLSTILRVILALLTLSMTSEHFQGKRSIPKAPVNRSDAFSYLNDLLSTADGVKGRVMGCR